jgi:hypothetical protein
MLNMPKTSLGKWSVSLIAVFTLLLILSDLLTGLGGVGPGLVGPILGVAFGISGIGALVTGLISIIKSKERSILVFLAVLGGIFALIFFLGEFHQRIFSFFLRWAMPTLKNLRGMIIASVVLYSFSSICCTYRWDFGGLIAA